MATTKEGAQAAATAAVTKRPSAIRKAAKYIPAFVLVFIFFILVKISVTNVRTTVMTVLTYSVSWAELIFLVSSMTAMFELLRVSRPGIDNTGEALRMLLVSVTFIVIFTLSTAAVFPWSSTFANTEFLFLMLVSITQTVMAFIINARTLKRTIDYTGNDH